jgi:hypothetical protein
VKIALHDGDKITSLESQSTDDSTLQDVVTTFVADSGISQVGFATSTFRDDEGNRSWGLEEREWVSVFDYNKLVSDTGCTVGWIGNDAEATAIATNDPRLNVKYWQSGIKKPIGLRGVVYLGTGFQFCPIDSSGRAFYGVNFLMPLGDGVINEDIREKLNELFKTRLNISKVNLRIKDICSGVGIENINEALTGKRIPGEEIGRLGNSETYQVFSEVLGGVLRQIFSTGSYRGGLLVGGTLAAVLESNISPHLVLK